jgi:hypothetical protein
MSAGGPSCVPVRARYARIGVEWWGRVRGPDGRQRWARAACVLGSDVLKEAREAREILGSGSAS